jgi:glutamine amidotransferase PdxT
MNRLNRITLIIALVLTSSVLFANGEGNVRPQFVRSEKFVELISSEKFNPTPVVDKKETATPASSAKVSNNNDQINYVAVMVEKTNFGELNNSFSVAMSVLEKEKKQMKSLFFPTMKTVEKYTVYSSCQALAGRLKNLNNSLKVYDILDADILGSKYLTYKK